MQPQDVRAIVLDTTHTVAQYTPLRMTVQTSEPVMVELPDPADETKTISVLSVVNPVFVQRDGYRFACACGVTLDIEADRLAQDTRCAGATAATCDTCLASALP